jgi:wyosine [tRNA(Phe)-imidazoG37] synthetase (radical SAM superfamily)
LGNGKLPTREEVQLNLKIKLTQMRDSGQLPDVITFAGNGEPTLHPQFDNIIQDTIELRNDICPKARIAVLSNATRLNNPSVIDALKKVDDNILKLDSGLEKTIMAIDRPSADFNLKTLINQLVGFNGQLTIQTLFLRGTVNGVSIDNTTHDDLISWIDILKQVKPRQVMIYTISRDTPFDTLHKIPKEELSQIARQLELLGFNVQVSN